MATAENIADISAEKIAHVSTMFSVFACVYVYMSVYTMWESRFVCLSLHTSLIKSEQQNYE